MAKKKHDAVADGNMSEFPAAEEHVSGEEIPVDTGPNETTLDSEEIKHRVRAAMARWEAVRAHRLELESQLEAVADDESSIAREVKALVGTSFRYKGAAISITERKGERAYFRGFGKQPSLVEIE